MAGRRMINREWHAANRMPPNASRSERLRWHERHAKACGCRPIPRSLQGVVSGGPRVRKPRNA
jgi:hypothetical protein